MTDRHCGACTLCCRLLPVREFAKSAGERCRHQSSKGCAIYHRPGFPRSCDLWSCRWLVNPGCSALRRPDRTHYVIDIMPDLIRATHNETGAEYDIDVIQVWVDPAFPEAWGDPALLAYVEAEGCPMLVRYSSEKAITVVPPAMNSEHRWLVIDNATIRQSVTGSMLLDRLGGHLGPP